jgi:hypothetical protein
MIELTICGRKSTFMVDRIAVIVANGTGCNIRFSGLDEDWLAVAEPYDEVIERIRTVRSKQNG